MLSIKEEKDWKIDAAALGWVADTQCVLLKTQGMLKREHQNVSARYLKGCVMKINQEIMLKCGIAILIAMFIFIRLSIIWIEE